MRQNWITQVNIHSTHIRSLIWHLPKPPQPTHIFFFSFFPLLKRRTTTNLIEISHSLLGKNATAAICRFFSPLVWRARKRPPPIVFSNARGSPARADPSRNLFYVAGIIQFERDGSTAAKNEKWNLIPLRQANGRWEIARETIGRAKWSRDGGVRVITTLL